MDARIENFLAKAHKRILIADDDVINREILGMFLESEYDLAFASDGLEALNYIRANEVDLVLLDIMMPKMDGLTFLKEKAEDKAISKIPVVVLTSDGESEIEALQLGAVDFIKKPYRHEVVMVRVERTIELFQSIKIINNTSDDTLTGLLTREYFDLFLEDKKKIEDDYDMLSIGAANSASFLELYGVEHFAIVLKEIGLILLEYKMKYNAIATRDNEDIFYVFSPHRHKYEYESLLAEMKEKLQKFEGAKRIHLRFGVYPHVDTKLKNYEIFFRTRLAYQSVVNDHTNRIGYYNKEFHDKVLFRERLIEDFASAIKNEEFVVYYQPKVNIRGEKPVIGGAEALVRWKHPELGMVSPGLFIGIFEETGLIKILDSYLFRKIAMQISIWKKKNINVPVSINLSRIDILKEGLKEELIGLAKEFDLDYNDFHLEVTESAYTDSENKVINVVSELKEAGFVIELDDFGAGYSSLNMIGQLPLNILKLDMVFMRNLNKSAKNEGIVEWIIKLAKYMELGIVAEGVETEEQYKMLKRLGCDMIQGYYFSKPVPSEEFERMLVNGL